MNKKIMATILAHAVTLITVMQANPRGSLLFIGLIAVVKYNP